MILALSLLHQHIGVLVLPTTRHSITSPMDFVDYEDKAECIAVELSIVSYQANQSLIRLSSAKLL